jgi:Ca2+-dependent lipid-binding protein
MEFLPLKMRLDPKDSFSNSGTLKIDILDAEIQPTSNQNAHIDPRCQFLLDKNIVYETLVKLKTFNPVWNERFEITIPSRTANNLVCNVFDWDIGGNAELIGQALLDLPTLEPFVPKEVRYSLGATTSSIGLRLLFTPNFVSRTSLKSEKSPSTGRRWKGIGNFRKLFS